MTHELISTFIKISDLDIYISITFKCSKDSNDNIILHEIKFFKNINNLLEYVNSNKYLLIEKQIDIHDDTIDKLLTLIKNYLSGKKINLYDEFKQLDVEISLEQKFPTLFSYKIIQSLLAIEYGELTSYSQLGEVIGSKAYRAIGTILKRNPLPLVIPCHRVVKKNGQIGGFMGSTNNGWEKKLKHFLINMESIHN